MRAAHLNSRPDDKKISTNSCRARCYHSRHENWWLSSKMQVILSSCPPSHAKLLATKLVEQRLAACVKLLGPVQSVYRWDGDVQHDNEMVLMIKTTATRWNALVEWMSEHHPYDVPELIALDAGKTAEGYLSWVLQQTAQAPGA